MAYYTQLGTLPPKRHTQFRAPNGKLYSEEVFGTEGFVGPTSTLYHINAPTQVHGWKPLYACDPAYVERSSMRMRHLKTAGLKPKGDPVEGRIPLFGNDDCLMSICLPRQEMAYHFKNAVADECFFIHHGTGTFWTMFGTLRFGPKDLVVVPKGTIYRMEFDRPAKHAPANRFLLIESVNGSHMLPPPRYLSKQSAQLLEHAPFCERDFRLPTLPLSFDERGEFEVRIKSRGHVHSYIYDYHPLDVVGWDGCYYPYIFNVNDFSPIVGKHHLPPPTHQVFDAHNFVICAFCPRPLDFHPEAIVVPYNHSNLDSDEVLYYVEGNYKARRGIESGSLTLHPQGIPHGPHPGTVEKSIGATQTDELAIMCDTFRPLFPTKAALGLDDRAYPISWQDGALTATASAHVSNGKVTAKSSGSVSTRGRRAAASTSTGQKASTW